MAITIVGTRQVGNATNGNNVTLTFDVTPSQNDIVILTGGNGNDDGNEPFGPVTAGYTEIWASAGNTTTEPAFGAWYKVQGASPDTNVVGNGGADTNDAVGYCCVVLRGVDTSTPMDATRTTAGPTSSTNPDAAAINTATAGAWVVVAACNGVVDTSITAPSGYSNSGSASAGDTNNYSTAIATKEIASPTTENPPSWTTWSTGVWKAVTIAVRPASTVPQGSGSGSISWAGSATGTTVRSGSASGSIAWAGASTGTTVRSGAATGSITWAGTADGEAPVVVQEGEGIGSITWAGTATGTTVRSGSSTGTVTWTGTATGTATHNGSSTGTVTWTGAATGATTRAGAATGTITWTGSATGQAPVSGASGSATGSITWAGTATGDATFQGNATGTVTWTGSSTGTAGLQGSAAGTIIWTGTADGVSVHQGSATGAVAWTGTAAGEHTRHTFWEYNPVGYATAGVGYTLAPVGYTPMDPSGG